MIEGNRLDERFDEFVDDNMLNILRSLNKKFRKMSPAKKGEFILQVFGSGGDGKIHIEDVDLSDFYGDVAISGWKVDGNLYQDHQEVGKNLYQYSQKVGWNLHQDQQEAGGDIIQDEQKAPKDMCVEPDYKAEYEKMGKELYEANRKIETLMWVLGKIKEASK